MLRLQFFAQPQKSHDQFQSIQEPCATVSLPRGHNSIAYCLGTADSSGRLGRVIRIAVKIRGLTNAGNRPILAEFESLVAIEQQVQSN